MKMLLLAVACALGGAAHASVILPSDPGTAWKAVADRLHSTVVEVRGQQAQETVSYGTGVLIGNGLAITTLHSVAQPTAGGRMTPLQDVRVLVPDVGPMDAQGLAGSTDLDLAILTLPEGAPLGSAPLATELPSEGDTLVAMGAGDQEITVLGVVVSAVDGEMFTVSSKRVIDSRFWGGPLFDARGRLVGVLLTSLGRSKAISARAIQRLVDERGSSPAP